MSLEPSQNPGYDLPEFAIITDGRHHDVRVARENLSFKSGDTVVFDKGYVDYAWMHDLQDLQN